MSRSILVTTRKHSKLFSEILERFSCKSKTYALIDGRKWLSVEFSELQSSWCKNSEIKRTWGFKLSSESREIYKFHDDPEYLFADLNELKFLQGLEAEKIVRLKIVEINPSFWSVILSKAGALFSR